MALGFPVLGMMLCVSGHWPRSGLHRHLIDLHDKLRFFILDSKRLGF